MAERTKNAAPPPAGAGGRYYPPTGTYPSPGEAPATSGLPAPDATPPQKVRRVGTFTMALCLIAVGVVLLLAVFLPELDYLFIARLAPLALVLLGVELLVATVRHRGEKLRMDFLSILVCLVLIAGSLLGALIPHYLMQEREASQTAYRLEAQLEEASYLALAQGGPRVSSVEWYVGLYSGNFTTNITPQQLRSEHTVQLRVTLEDDYGSAGAFAADVRKALESLRPLVAHIDYASFYTADARSSGDQTGYALWLENRHQVDASDSSLEDRVAVFALEE